MKNLKEKKQALLKEYPQLKKLQRRKIVAFLVKLLVVEGLMAGLTIYLFDKVGITGLLFGVLLGLILFLYFSISSKFFKRMPSGKIQEITTKTTEKGLALPRLSLTRDDSILLAVFKVQQSNGKNKEFVLELRYEHVYTVGSEIIGLYGIPFPIKVGKNGMTVCPFCGNIFPFENGVCVECGAERIACEFDA